MAEPIFKTIDFSRQIAEDQARTNAANLAGIQNLANTYLAGRQYNINQARQLMSDFSAVIDEVDDIHKEGVSEAIAETQKKLANNIYKKKGKNGVRLNLGDLNSKDFNYARDMRKLKNMATNSRLVKQQLTDVKNNIKTDRYILSNADRANAAADVSTYLSSSEALNQSPEELNDQVRTIYRKYRDNVGEGVDLYVRDLVRTNSSALGLDEDGNQILTSTAYFESLSKYNPETKQIEVDMDKIDAVAENYAAQGNIIQSEKEDYKIRLAKRAELVRTQKVQDTAIDLKRKKAALESAKVRDENIKVNTLATLKRLEDFDKTKDYEKQLTEAENAVINEIQKGAQTDSPIPEAFFESLRLTGKNAFYVRNEQEYVDFVLSKAKENADKNGNLEYIDEKGNVQFGSEVKAKEAYKRAWAELTTANFGKDDLEKKQDFLVVDYPGNKKPSYIDLTKGNSYELIKRLIGLNYTSKEKKLDFYKYMYGRTSGSIPAQSNTSSDDFYGDINPDEI